MPGLILGPLLRHVATTSATVWVETDSACEVAVLGHTSRTFTIEGHHYALVIIEDLEPGTVTPYDVRLDGERCWPLPATSLPASVIRTRDDDDGPLRILFGSCRTAAPHEPPWTLELAHDDRGRGVDAVWAHALRMVEQPPAEWPHAIMMLGDQVYADDSSPFTRAKVAARRQGGDHEPPLDNVADYEEYTWLYHESWGADLERWFLSVVPSAMIIDDHDMIDDWNISESWQRDIRDKPWWRARVIGGLMSYWVYQHLGNLSPDEIREEGMLDDLVAADDGTAYLREWARERAGLVDGPGLARRATSAQFSFWRDFGRTRLIVIDCRTSRVLTPGHRLMVDEEEMAWVAERCRGDLDHLLIASSLPAFVSGGLHDLQSWNEAICDGAWGRFGAWLGERLRRSLDAEDWPAFIRSFDALVELLSELATREGQAPATISVVSGDIHFSYLADIELSTDIPAASAVHQIVASPIRNALTPRERRVLRFVLSGAGRVIGRVLRRSARRHRSTARWKLTHGPIFCNSLAQVSVVGRTARLTIEQVTSLDDGTPRFEVVVDAAL